MVDDGSVDGTNQMVGQYFDSRIRYFYLEHGERSCARNYGIDKSTGRYLCFIDDDDYIKPSYLLEFNDYLSARDYPTVLLRTGFEVLSYRESRNATNYESARHGNAVQFIAFNMCGVGSLCIPLSCLTEDRFPEDFHHYQDTHLFLRLTAKYPMVQLNSWNYVYYIHRESFATFPAKEFRARAINNVEAILDVFRNYGYLINKYVPEDTGSRLAAEKAMQHTAIALVRGRIADAFFLFSLGSRYDSIFSNMLKMMRHLPGLVVKRLKGKMRRKSGSSFVEKSA